MFVCKYIGLYIYISKRAGAFVGRYLRGCIHVHTDTHLCVYVRVYIYLCNVMYTKYDFLCVFVCIYVCVTKMYSCTHYICICVYIFVCIYVCVYIC